MKNKRIIDAWNKIEPDRAADERMLNAIYARNRSVGQSEKEKVSVMKKALSWKRFTPVAACLVMVIAVTMFFGNNAGWFGSRVYTVDMENGRSISFYKMSAPHAGIMDFGGDVTSRNLTSDENNSLFGDLDVSSIGTFNAQNKKLLRVEDRVVNTKLILAAQGVPVTDTIIETKYDDSEIDGIQVSAGYFITDANSGGIRNIIYVASFKLNGISVYVECDGKLLITSSRASSILISA